MLGGLMKESNKAKNVVEYYVLCNKLKNIIRSGWIYWNVKKERLESVAEHIFGVQSLAIAMWSEYEYDLDFNKVLFMLALHELEEIIIGDLTAWDITPEEKIEKGHEAVHRVLKNLLQKEKLESLVLEFDASLTKEAIFAFQCDKLECDLQSKLYDEAGYVDIKKKENNPLVKDPSVQALLEKRISWSSLWLRLGRGKYPYDDHFIEVSNYVEDNKIG